MTALPLKKLGDAPSRDASAVSVVMAGRLDDPQFAAAFKGVLDRLAAGSRKPMPPPKIDWSVSKEENIRREWAKWGIS